MILLQNQSSIVLIKLFKSLNNNCSNNLQVIILPLHATTKKRRTLNKPNEEK